MKDPKSPQQRRLDDLWEELIEQRENQRKDEEFWKEAMEQPVFEEWERPLK